LNILNDSIGYILSFKPYVLLPLILLVFSVVFRIPLGKAILSSLKIGIGFIGIFIIFGYFVSNIGPAVQALTSRTGLKMNVLDVGWTPLAIITWSYKLTPLLLLLVICVNLIMLAMRKTRTVNIDIWNYWHFIFIGIAVYEATYSMVLSALSVIASAVLTLKLADWSAEAIKSFSGLSGITTTTISGLCYFPIGLAGDRILDKIPFIQKIRANPDTMKEKLGVFGEPILIGFIIGLLLGVGSGYDIKNTLELSFSIAAVIYILPLMTGILGHGLIPISDGMKYFIKRKFPNASDYCIGLDLAILVGNPGVIITGLLLMPVSLLMAFILPGIRFIPLGDLANLMGAIVMVVVATRCNIIRSFIISIPIIIAKLYVASEMSVVYTSLAQKVNYRFEGYNGMITSFLDGGNLLKYWFIKLFEGNPHAALFLPVVFAGLYFTWRVQKSEQTYNLTDSGSYKVNI